MPNRYNPLEFMRLRNDKGLRSVVSATMFAEDAHLRYDSKHEVWRGHQGWDLVAEVGTPAFAIADGYIAWTRDIGDFGKQLLLQFDNGLQSTKYQSSSTTLFAFYAHLSEFLVD